jgi:hypothetical protein
LSGALVESAPGIVIMQSWLRGLLPFLCLIVLAGIVAGSPPDRTEVLVVSSLHSAHRDHATFDYDVLFSLVRDFDPDFVGAEIRPEDIGMGEQYLSSNYPHEMVELARRYQGRAFGFDWLGYEIAGTPIPESYFKDLHITKLSAELTDDEAMMAKKPEQIARLEQQQADIVAAATPASLADGRYGALCRQIDELEQSWLAGSRYEPIFAFNRLRDEEIARNLVRFIESHPGSRIVAVLGADHRTFAVEAVLDHFDETVEMVEVSDLRH